MNLYKRDIARTKFKLEIYQSKGTAFQDFFVRIMSKAYPDFLLVKPHGNVGDEKNDGFIPSKGMYYQVYAPENPESGVSVINAVAKCKKDFAGLLAAWNNETPIKEFHFVFNDEYRGAYPKLHHVIAEIQKNHKGIKITLLLVKDLEDVFLNLSEEKIQDVIGYIPEPGGFDSLDYDVLTDVVKHLLSNAKPLASDGNLKVPNFDEKIKFNNLSQRVASLLNTASFQISVLYDFFENNSGFSRQDLRDIFVDLYQKSQNEFPQDAPNRADLIFFNIIKKASLNKQSKNIEDAILVLMSYFFEACDIFEEPK